MTREGAFVDTSALYALFAPSDAQHAAARAALERLRDERAPLVTSSAVLLESHVLVHARTGRAGLLRFHRAVGTSAWLRAVAVNSATEASAWALLEARHDKDYSIVDAMSFVLMRALRMRRAFSFDEHFRQEGFEILP